MKVRNDVSCTHLRGTMKTGPDFSWYRSVVDNGEVESILQSLAKTTERVDTIVLKVVSIQRIHA